MARGLDDALRSQLRLNVRRGDQETDFQEFLQEVAAFLERLQNGGVMQWGQRIEIRDEAPTEAPAANQPNLILMDDGSGPHFRVWVSGTGWVNMATTSVPGDHALVGSQHTASGLTIGHFLKATAADAFAFAAHGLGFSDLSGSIADGQVPESAVTQHEAALSIATTQLTGDMPDARIVPSNVTQHEASLTILESQITDGSVLARVAANETVSGYWEFSNASGFKTDDINERNADHGVEIDSVTLKDGTVIISSNQVVGARQTGWTASTGTAARGAYATHTGQTITNPPTQTEVQNIDDHLVVLSQQLKAVKDDLITHGLIGT